MIIFALCLSIVALILQISLYPHLPIVPFTPFLAVLCLVAPLPRALLFATIAGLVIDLLSNDPFGVTAVSFTLTTLFCYRWRSLFSLDSPLAFALLTALVSFISTQLQLALFFLFDRRIGFLGSWWLTQWILLPLFDATFALIWFVGPLMLYKKLHRKWLVYWLRKRSQH